MISVWFEEVATRLYFVVLQDIAMFPMVIHNQFGNAPYKGQVDIQYQQNSPKHYLVFPLGVTFPLGYGGVLAKRFF